MSDLFGGIDLGSIFAGELADVIALLNAVVAAFEALLGALNDAFGQVGDDQNYIYGFSYDGMSSIWDALKKLATVTIWGAITNIWGKLLSILKKLQDFINKLEKYYKILEKNYREHVLAGMKQYLDMIQRIRKILVPLKLLHVKWASALDLKFLGLESKLGQAFAAIIAHDNQVLTVLNEIHDPRGLLRPGHTLGSLGTMIGAVHGAVKALDPRTLLCMPGPMQFDVLSEPWIAYQSQVVTDMQQNTGDYSDATVGRNTIRAMLADDLGVPQI